MLLPVLRIILGLLFILTGVPKILAPYQNFLYVVQSYQFFPSAVEELAARFVPWVEFLLGVFVLLGLWLKSALKGLWCLITIFIFILAQAIVRGLPVDHCGCFGSWFSVPIQKMVLLDCSLWLLTLLMLLRIEKTSVFSLDHYFSAQR